MASVVNVLIAVGVIYLAILGYLWVTQRSHVYRPGIGPLDLINSTVAAYMREVVIRTSDGLALTAWYSPTLPARLCCSTARQNASSTYVVTTCWVSHYPVSAACN